MLRLALWSRNSPSSLLLLAVEEGGGLAPPPSGITTAATTTGGCWSSSGPKGSVVGAAAAGGVLRRRRAAPEPEPEERTISSCARATSSSFLARALLRRSGCCCFGESGIRWAGRGGDCEVVGCCEMVVVECDDREIPWPPGCGVVTPPRSSPCSGLRGASSWTCCAPARAGASPPPGCLCLLAVLEKGGVPIPSSTNVCVCPKNLPRRKVPELWGSPRPPRLAVHVVVPELRATVSITYCLFS